MQSILLKNEIKILLENAKMNRTDELTLHVFITFYKQSIGF